ncbi:helix-turn-helix transcriptional regulator [Chitinophaga lutea]
MKEMTITFNRQQPYGEQYDGAVRHWRLKEGITVVYTDFEAAAPVKFCLAGAAGDYYICLNMDPAWDGKQFGAGARHTYWAYYNMTARLSDVVLPARTRVRTLQFVFNRDVFDSYFDFSADDESKLQLAELLAPEHFCGCVSSGAGLIMQLLKTPRASREGFAGEFRMSACFYDVFFEFLRCHVDPVSEARARQLTDVGRVIDVNERIASASDGRLPTIAEAAKASCICDSKFKALFKSIYGNTYHQYHLRLRLGAAIDQMRYSGQNIHTIIRNAGFLHAGKFAQVFKEHFNMLPREFQKRCCLDNAG